MKIDRKQAAEVFRVAWKMQQENRSITYDHGNKIIDAVCEHGDFFSEAPNLRDSLEGIIDAYEGKTFGTVYEMDRAISAARALLAKARGEEE